MAKKRIMARMVSELIATGFTTFPDGSAIRIDGFQDYFELVRWVYKHVDGDVSRHELGGPDGGPVLIQMTWGDVDAGDGSDGDAA